MSTQEENPLELKSAKDYVTRAALTIARGTQILLRDATALCRLASREAVMPRTERFRERIGAIFLPEADVAQITEEPAPVPEVTLPSLGPGVPGAGPGLRGELGRPEVFPFKFCS